MRARLATSFGLVLLLSAAGCKSTTPTASTPAPIVDMNNGADPALANLATVDPNAPVVNESQTTATRTTTARALGARSSYQPTQSGEQYPDGQYDAAYDQYESQVDAGQQALYADRAPPELPVYQQPELTEANDQWTPGYWSYAQNGYYFVPGAWVAPPYTGALWTPGYWGYEGRRYRFHHGFWGRHIGYYGGISYGFGYFGRGYEGGYWNDNNFFYNRNVNRVNVVNVRNVYERNVAYTNNNRYSYNGPGGYTARPLPAELAVYREQRLPPLQVQRVNREQAAQNRQQFFAENHGRPAIAVASQRFAADRALPRAIEPAQRGGFGQAQQQQALQQRNLQQQQMRTQQEQQRVVQQQQRVQQQQQAQQQRQGQNQQRVQQQQQRVQQEQQRTQQNQQRQVQNQQAQQQRVQQQQLRTQQTQQRQIQNQQGEQQRAQQQQQRTQQMQQRQVQNQQANQQRAAQQQQRTQQMQQRQVQNQQVEQQRAVQQQQRTQQMQQRQVQQAQPARPQAPVQQPRQEAPRAPAAQQQHVEAPHAAPAQPHGGGEHGGRPRL